ncbi:uncharacterized protein LOC133202604 [Saccostrea echinata]|uniref:uncharacterized protein LOC133202604 n=1 Tax=Saccostrea echinata TaxID=191078 RepID=UPI002A83307E|nr:uncharacterized protein LOC133202604 [Saccostrea echinata]
MVRLTSTIVLLAETILHSLAYVPDSNMDCQCTCSPFNSPPTNFLPGEDLKTSVEPTTQSVPEEETQNVPLELRDSTLKDTQSPEPKSYINKTNKDTESNMNTKETLEPHIMTYSTRPVLYGTMSPTSAIVQPNSPIQLKVTSSAFRTKPRRTTRPPAIPKRNKNIKWMIDPPTLMSETNKSRAITLDDIIFGKVPYNMSSSRI